MGIGPVDLVTLCAQNAEYVRGFNVAVRAVSLATFPEQIKAEILGVKIPFLPVSLGPECQAPDGSGILGRRKVRTINPHFAPLAEHINLPDVTVLNRPGLAPTPTHTFHSNCSHFFQR